ncbi:MAG TPA: integration host factor [Clostridiales bacterium]|nr:integration host factor [Clostridiales bacterium]
MALPVLTLQQRRKALEKAQAMRSRRKEMRQRLKKGRLSLRDVLDGRDNEVMAKMRVAYLLASLPRVGKTTARRIMEEIGIDDSRRVQGLGKRQRGELLKRLASKR